VRDEVLDSDGVAADGGRAAERDGEFHRGVFMISVAAELASMHPQTLRTYEARGLIKPKRSPKGTRLYSRADVELLRRIQRMTAELGLNLAGVERVLELEAENERLRGRLAELEAELAAHLERTRAAEERIAVAVEEVRRSLKAELVRWRRPTGTTVVRLRDLRWPRANPNGN